jgi:hypothetical protein
MRVEGADGVTPLNQPQCGATNGDYFVCPFSTREESPPEKRSVMVTMGFPNP